MEYVSGVWRDKRTTSARKPRLMKRGAGRRGASTAGSERSVEEGRNRNDRQEVISQEKGRAWLRFPKDSLCASAASGLAHLLSPQSVKNPCG